MSQDPDVASAVAAIRSLLEFLKRDQSKTTVQHPFLHIQFFVVNIKKIVFQAIDRLSIHLFFFFFPLTLLYFQALSLKRM